MSNLTEAQPQNFPRNATILYIGRDPIRCNQPITVELINKEFENFLPSLEKYGLKSERLIVTKDLVSLSIADDCKIEFSYKFYQNTAFPTINLITPSDLALRQTKLPIYNELERVLKTAFGVKNKLTLSLVKRRS